MILDGTIPPDKERESLQVISSETRRLSRLVRRMLDLSRMQSDQRISAQEQFDAVELLLRVLVSLEQKITEKELDVETTLPDGPVMVWGDPDAVTQVCYNLLDNAVKFSTPGGRLSLKITTRAGKAYLYRQPRGDHPPPTAQLHFRPFPQGRHLPLFPQGGRGPGPLHCQDPAQCLQGGDHRHQRKWLYRIYLHPL